MMVASSRVSPSPPQPALTPEASSEPTSSGEEAVPAASQTCQDTLSNLIEAVSSSSTSPTNTSSDSSSVASDFVNLFAAVQQQQQQQNQLVTDSMDASSPPAPSNSGSDGGPVLGPDFSIKADIPALNAEFPVKQEINPMDSLIALDPSAFWQMLQQHNEFLNIAQRVQQQAQVQRIQQQGSHDRKRSSPSTFQYCELCQKDVHSSKLPCHIRQYHVGKPMFQCPACDFASTYSKNNVKSHMVSLHGLAGDPVSYMEKYAPQVEQFMKVCFPNVRGRGMSVRGRGRHMQSRPSPRSSASPQMKVCKPMASASLNNYGNMQFARSSSLIVPGGPDMARRNSISENKPTVSRNRDELLLMTQPQLPILASNGFPFLAPSILNSNFNNNNNIAKDESRSLLETLNCKDTFDFKYFNMDEIHLDVPIPFNLADSSDEEQSYDYLDNVMTLVYDKPSSSKDYETCSDRIESRYASGLISFIRNKNDVISQQNWWLRSFSEEKNITPTSLLNQTQAAEVAQVRNDLLASKPSFEVLYGLNKMDLGLLPAVLVEKVLTIAPNELDAKVIRSFVQDHPHAITTDEERFLVELAQIDRLEDKLAIMIGMARYEERLNFIEKRIIDCTVVTRKVCKNKSLFDIASYVKRSLATILPADAIQEFPISKLNELSEHITADGTKIFEKVVELLQANQNLMDVFDLSEPIRAVYKTNFNKVASAIKTFYELTRHCEREISTTSTSNENLIEFAHKVSNQYSRLYRLYNKLKTNFYDVYTFLCEDHSSVSVVPLHFMGDIAEFLDKLQAGLIPIIPKLEEPSDSP